MSSDPEQEIRDAIERQTEIIEAIAARVGERGREYASIAVRTASSMASIWFVMKFREAQPLRALLDYAAESVIVAGTWKVMHLMGVADPYGVQFDRYWEEFQSDVLNISRNIYLKESGNGLV